MAAYAARCAWRTYGGGRNRRAPRAGKSRTASFVARPTLPLPHTCTLRASRSLRTPPATTINHTTPPPAAHSQLRLSPPPCPRLPPLPRALRRARSWARTGPLNVRARRGGVAGKERGGRIRAFYTHHCRGTRARAGTRAYMPPHHLALWAAPPHRAHYSLFCAPRVALLQRTFAMLRYTRARHRTGRAPTLRHRASPFCLSLTVIELRHRLARMHMPCLRARLPLQVVRRRCSWWRLWNEPDRPAVAISGTSHWNT